jgi:hypothetical protein
MAPPKQLRAADLAPGDVLLQYKQDKWSNVAGKAIAFGQAMAGDANSELVHAGVMFDKSYMIEALSSGITGSDVRIQNKAYAYRVFRPRNAKLGQTEGNVVKFLFDHHQSHGSMPYAWAGAVASLGAPKPMSATNVDRMMDDIFQLKPTAFFCSQFVVMSYQLAAAQMGLSPKSVFPLDDSRMPPSRLAMACEASSAFDGIGYMEPNVR